MPRPILRARAAFGAFAGALLVLQALQPFVAVAPAGAAALVATTTTVATSKASTVSGESVTFTATVVATTNPTPPAPSGTVAFTGPGTTPISGCDAATLTPTSPGASSATATCTTTALPVGTDVVTASYSGDTIYDVSQGTVTQTVSKAATTGTLTSQPNPSLQNETVTLTDTLAVTAPGSGSPTGTVAFSTPGGPISGCTAQPITAGKATCTTVFPTRGAFTVTATYAGDASFTGNSAQVTQNVGTVESSTALSTSASPSVFGQTVTFTAKVTSTHVGTPTGSVSFTDGTAPATPIVTCQNVPLDATVSAKCVLSSLSVGGHAITATYSGDINFASSSSPALGQTVSRASTTTTPSSTPNPSVFSQPVTLSATVAANSPGTGTPTGTVTFKDGATSVCSVTLTGGHASCSVSNLSVGAHTINASYLGDDNFISSSGTAASPQTVSQADTSLAVSSSKNPTVSGEGVTFTATLSPVDPATGAPTAPTGTVDFKDGATVICTGATVTAGKATCGKSNLTPGPHTISASYSGDTNYKAVDSAVNVVQTVNKDNTATVVTSSKNPAEMGDTVTYTATVTAAAPGSGVPSGTVSFFDGGSGIGSCGNVTVTPVASNATATCQVNNPTLGTHPITATYSGDTNFNASTSPTFDQVVNKHGTATGLTANPASTSKFGTTVAFNATVSATTAGVPAPPDGTVSFTDSVTASAICPPVTLVNGSASCSTTTPLAVGAHTITATYNGNADYGTSSNAITYTVTKADTTTAVTSSKPSPVSGETVDLTATITTSAPGTPTGTVSFTSNGHAISGCSTLAVTATPPIHAVCTTSALAVGNNSIVATYSGDSSYATSSGLLSQTVTKAQSTTAVSSSLNPSVKGQSVTFTATVTPTSPGSGTATGTISFKDGAATLCTAAMTGGQATCTPAAPPGLSAGSHNITAVYSGDGNFVGSTSAVVPQTVNKADTTTAVDTTAPDGALLGQPITFTATVTVTAPGAGTPTGSVDFKSDGSAISGCTSRPLASDGTATCDTNANTLGNGTHQITAVYNGDPGYNTSTSPALTQVIGAVGSTTALTSSANPSVTGQAVTLTASVTSTAPGTPTGTMSFQDGGGAIAGCTNVTVDDHTGQATCTPAGPLAVGTHSMTATYSGDVNFRSSTGTLTQTVNQGSTGTGLTSSANPSSAGQSVTFTATVSPAAPAAGTPTGTVTFKDGSTTLCAAVGLATGHASCTTSALSAGSHSITGVYGGNANFAGSTSSVLTQTVNKVATTTGMASSANPSSAGQSVTFTATVSTTGTPTGTVTFKDGSATLCAAVGLATGQASCTTSALSAGSHSITGVYSGDGTFATSTSPALTQTVNAPPVVHHSGYWMLTRAGQVFAFGDAVARGDAATLNAVHIEPTPAGDGYWVIDERGHLFAFNAPNFGGAADRLQGGESVTSLSATPDGGGYWIFTNKGRVMTFGNAPFLGDMSATVLNGPVLGSVATPTGQGYYMVAADGGVFAFGDAKFRGSMGGKPLNAPVQSLVPDRSNGGYWLVASDGGLFSFGDAPFKGSMGGKPLNAPITGMVRYGDAYLMVGRDGGVFNFSNKPFAGSLGNNPPGSPVVGVGTLDT